MDETYHDPVGRAQSDTEATETDMTRRRYLTGAATLGIGAAGLAGEVTAAVDRYGITFDRVLDAVDDLGLDPTGEKAIDRPLAKALGGGDTLVEFPAGTYYFKKEVDFGSPDNWGIRGLGSDPTDVRFRTTAGEGRYLLKTGGGTGQLVENVSLDYSADDDGGLGMILRGPDAIRVQDVEFVGFNPTDGNGAVLNLVPMAEDPDGRAVVDGLVRTGPTDIVSHGHLDGDSNESCIWLGDRHEGELLVRNTHVENCGTNAVYASRTTGTVHYENCLFKNNNQTSIRVGGGAGEQNTITDCTFVVDTDDAHPDNGGEFINPHGVVCETNDTEPGPVRIENCEFSYRTGPDRGRLLFVDGNAGPIEVVDSRFRSEVDAAEALYGRGDPRWGDPAPDQSIDIEGQFSGSGAVDVDDRPATMHSGCLSCPVEGVDVDDSVSRDSCTLPGADSDSTTDETSTSTESSEIVLTGNGVETNYLFSVGGTVEATDDVEDWDEVGESSVDGWVTSDGTTDTYRFTGPLGRVRFAEGNAHVSVGDSEVDPATLSTSDTYPNTLQIPGTGTKTNYRIQVTGEIRDHPVLGTPLSDADTVDGGTIDGWTTDEMDAIEFSGSIESIELAEGDGSMFHNGVEIDPTSDAYDPLPNSIVFDGTASDQPTTYEFSVSGEVARSEDLSSGTDGSAVDSISDSVGDGTVEGYVEGGVDGYRYSGDLTALSVSGDADVTVADVDG